MHNEVLTDEELIERFKELINEFMTRPDRHYSYKTNMRWTLDHGNQIKYSVIISINQTCDSDQYETILYNTLRFELEECIRAYLQRTHRLFPISLIIDLSNI
ncbi:unnamed protein product [Rotaria sordida]|uniref:Uncharacterized protein n=1 Tax=Rotaria sordida TaxID=392033 RepID=A0A815TAE7_9BILA|nr:unnamed protein product [Rotaria sordida]